MRHLAALLLLLAAARPALACAPAPREGESIAVVEESALIVWDPASRTQHFIRRATFRGGARDFGFLVPTPTAPALAEVSDRVFDELEEATRRRTVYTESRQADFTPLLAMFFAGGPRETATNARAPVEVLSTHKVAGYDAAVLDATDAGALQRWLNENGYAAAPDLLEWLEAYVRQRWMITAFKIDPEGSFAARTSAVKMSFRTDRPFFPYREPASQRGSFDTGRSLRVFFAGPERVTGTVGANGHWPGVVTWSNAVPAALRGEIASAANVQLPPSLRLTALIDTSAIRPGVDDLFFSRDPNQGTYELPPHVDETIHKIPIPGDVIALLSLGVVVWLVRARRRRGPNIDAPGAVH